MVIKRDKIKEAKKCPIDIALDEINKKWTINIIKSIFLGSKRFNEIINDFTDLSNKVLSDRLKELETKKIVKKEIKSITPILIEYSLTEKGKSLNNILYELSMYTVKNHAEKLNINSEDDYEGAKEVLKGLFLSK